MDYKSVSEFAALRGVSPSRVRYWLKHDRLAGAKKAGSFWIIPAEANPGVKPVNRSGKIEEVSFREKEEAMLALCAGTRDVKTWRRAGTPRFMAGMALMLASVSGFDRARYLALAQKLDPTALSVGAFEVWFAANPYESSLSSPCCNSFVSARAKSRKNRVRFLALYETRDGESYEYSLLLLQLFIALAKYLF